MLSRSHTLLVCLNRRQERSQASNRVASDRALFSAVGLALYRRDGCSGWRYHPETIGHGSAVRDRSARVRVSPSHSPVRIALRVRSGTSSLWVCAHRQRYRPCINMPHAGTNFECFIDWNTLIAGKSQTRSGKRRHRNTFSTKKKDQTILRTLLTSKTFPLSADGLILVQIHPSVVTEI